MTEAESGKRVQGVRRLKKKGGNPIVRPSTVLEKEGERYLCWVKLKTAYRSGEYDQQEKGLDGR